MPFSLRFKRNNTVAQSKELAMSTLKEKLKLAHAGEPLVMEYSAPGGGETSLLFGISAGDGNYAIFDSEFKTINSESVFGDGNIDTHPTVKLTNQDLNDYSNASECVGKGYYALDGNTVSNKPSSTNGFIMQAYKSGDSSLTQMVYSLSAKKWYARTYNGSSWNSWGAMNDVDLSPYAKKTDLTKFQTESQVEAKISALVGSAPETLDTLNELAAALGDDPNFATTVTNKISGKVDKTTYASDKATFALKSEIPTSMAWTSITGKPTFAKVATSGSYNDLTNKPALYSLPTASSTVKGGVTLGYDENGRNYPLELDDDGKAYVNVPWTDTNTTYGNATQSASGLMSSSDKTKLDGIASGANKTVVDSTLSSSSTNPVQNKVVKSALDGKANSSHSHSISQVTNLQSSLDSKSNTGHTHTVGNITDLNSGWDTLLRNTPSVYVTSWPTISDVRNKQALKIQLNGGTTEGTNQFTYSGTTAKTINITPSSIGAASNSHTHNAATTTSAGFLNKLDGSTSHYLRGDGSWATPPNTTYGVATTSSNGLMSSSDKAKLDGIASGANKTVVDSGITSRGTNPVQGKAIYTALAGKANSSHTHPISQVTNLQSSLDSKSNVGHTHVISGLTDLNSGWDSLLKNSPTSYVTRWPSWGEVSGKPSTFTPSTHTHSYLPLSGGTLSGDLSITAGKAIRLHANANTAGTNPTIAVGQPRGNLGSSVLKVTCGSNDGFDLIAGGTSDNGYVTLATYDNGNEPIYVAQINDTPAITHLATLMDGSGNQKFNIVTAQGYKISGKATSDLLNGAGSTTSISTIQSQVMAGIVDGAPTTLDTLNELAAALGDDPNFATTITTKLGNKVDKVSGKELSSNDFTDAYKSKLDGIAAGANKTTVDSSLSSSSTNPVQNKVIKSALDGKANSSHTHGASQITGLSKVATSGSYNDLSNKPTIPSAYTLPTASSTQKGGITLGYSETGKNYPLELDDNGKAYVNVPWTDTNTTYSTATTSSNGLMSSSDKAKLDGIASGANKTIIDTSLSSSSTNPVQNKVVKSALDGKANTSHTHSISQVTNLQTTLDGKASTNHTHAISGLTDLNSGWDTYLKSAPSAYLTRWPSWSEVTNKPSTILGYGITDAPTKTGSGATGTWPISVSGSAVKLGTPRTIWGQSFDGTANIEGDLTNVSRIINEGYTHRLEIGRTNYDHWDFYEYGGLYNFYKNTETGNTNSKELLFQISGHTAIANTFKGNLSGNATSATKATQDGSGRTITTTYATTSHTHSTATTSSAGFLRQLNGSTSQYLRGDGTWATPPNTTYKTATASSDGLVRIGYPESGKNYPVELDSSHRMFVNVPWTDTNTTYGKASESADGLMSKENYIKLTDISNNMFLMEQMGLLEHGGNGYLERISAVTQSTTGITMNFMTKHLTSTGAVEQGFQNVILPTASTTKAGLMSAADKTKLNGLSGGGGAYLPLSGGTLTGTVVWNKGSGDKSAIVPGVIQVLNQTSTDYLALTPQTIQIYDSGNQMVDISTGNAVFNNSIQVTHGYNNMTSGIDISTTSGIVIHNSSHGVRFASGGLPTKLWTTNGGNTSLKTINGTSLIGSGNISTLSISNVTRVLAGGTSGTSLYDMETTPTSGSPSMKITMGRQTINENYVLNMKDSIFDFPRGMADVVGAQLISWRRSKTNTNVVLTYWTIYATCTGSNTTTPISVYIGSTTYGQIPVNTYLSGSINYTREGLFNVCIPIMHATGEYAGASKITIIG